MTTSRPDDGHPFEPVGPLSVQDLCQQLLHAQGPLQDDTLYVLSDFGHAAFVQLLPLEGDPGDSWTRLQRRARAIEVAEGLSAHRTFVFAASLAARRFAEHLRPRLDAEGGGIVHVDATGCRLAVPPVDANTGQSTHLTEDGTAEPPPSTGEETGLESPGWLSRSVREQRLAGLLAVRDAVNVSAAADLTGDQIAQVTDAFADLSIPIRCLTWTGTADERLWTHLAQRAPEPERTTARILLANIRHQQGNRTGAREALRISEEADLLRALQDTPEQTFRSRGAQVARLWSNPLFTIVVRFVLLDMGPNAIALAIDEAMARFDEQEQQH